MEDNLIHSRFKAAQWFKPGLEIIIGGLGGIGSHLNYILSRQGYTTYLYDFDTIEIHNVGSQMYSTADLNKNKAEKAAEIAATYGNKDYHILGKFTEDSPIGNIVFSCFDNMDVRKLMFDKWVTYQLAKTPEYRKENPSEINIFIDGRMVAESMQVYSVKTIKEIEVYKKTLFDSAEIEPAPCSYKATCQTGTMIGSLMSIVFLNHVANKLTGIPARDTPFATFFDNAMMYFKTYTANDYNKEF